MNNLNTLVVIAPKHTEATIIMRYGNRTRVRYITLHQSIDVLQEKIRSYELQFLHDVGANGYVKRTGKLQFKTDMLPLLA